MLPVDSLSGEFAIAKGRLSRGERSLMVIVAVGCLLLISLAWGSLRQVAPAPGPRLARAAAQAGAAPPIGADRAAMEFADAGFIDLAANAKLPQADRFAPAAGPPLNLLAAVDARLHPAVQFAAAPVPGPVLTEQEQLIVDANAQRRAVHLALAGLNARADASGLTVAVAVRPLLLRASLAAENLDAFADALLLADGAAEQEATYFGFQASRAAALGDLNRAAAMLS